MRRQLVTTMYNNGIKHGNSTSCSSFNKYDCTEGFECFFFCLFVCFYDSRREQNIHMCT